MESLSIRGFIAPLLLLIVVVFLLAGGGAYYAASHGHATAIATSPPVASSASTSQQPAIAGAPGYHLSNGKVYWTSIYSGDNALPASTSEVPGADAATFEPLLTPSGAPTYFAKDKNAIYDAGANVDNQGVFTCAGDTSAYPLPRGSIDAATFTLLFGTDPAAQPLYAKDKNHAYDVGGDLCQMSDADLSSFRPMLDEKGNTTSFSEDATHVYYEGCTLRAYSATTGVVSGTINPTSASLLFDPQGHATSYFIDNGQIYYALYPEFGCEATPVEGADLPTFQALPTATASPYDAQDKNHQYSQGSKVQE